MASPSSDKIKLRDSFLELTSDRALRMAAYPQEEWVKNGGSIYSGFLGGASNYTSIVTQDNPPEIIPQYGLLSLCNPEPVKQDLKKRAENIASHWQKVKSHDYYKWLMSDVNFKNAWSKFQNKKDKIEYNDLVSIFKKLKPINSEFADFRFCNLVTLHIGLEIIYKEFNYEPKFPHAKLFVKAKGHIEKLQADIRNGIKLTSYSSQDQLETLLHQLIIEIDQAPKKDYETITAKYRRRLENFALSFRLAFGFVSATILTDLSAMLGWSSDHATIVRIVQVTKSKHAQLLAKSLKEHTAQNSQK